MNLCRFIIVLLFSGFAFGLGEDDVILKTLDGDEIRVPRELAEKIKTLPLDLPLIDATQTLPVEVTTPVLNQLLDVLRAPDRLLEIENLVPLIRAADLLNAETVLNQALDAHGARIFGNEAVQLLQTLERDPEAYAEYRRTHLDELAEPLQHRIIATHFRRFGLVHENVVARLVHNFPNQPSARPTLAMISADGRYVVTAFHGRNRALVPIYFWIVATQRAFVIENTNVFSFSLSFSPDGRWFLARGYSDYTVWACDNIASDRPKPFMECRDIVFSNCGRFVAVHINDHNGIYTTEVLRAGELGSGTPPLVREVHRRDVRIVSVKIDGQGYLINFNNRFFGPGHLQGIRMVYEEDALALPERWRYGTLGLRWYNDQHGTRHADETLTTLRPIFPNREAGPIFVLFRDIRTQDQMARDGRHLLHVEGNEIQVVEMPQPERVYTLAAAQILHYRAHRLEATGEDVVLARHFEDAIDESPYARLLVPAQAHVVQVARQIPFIGIFLAWIVSKTHRW